MVGTDLSIAIPSGTYARVAPRSGLAVKHFIDTGAGVVDKDYRGTVGVVLFNHSESDYQGQYVFLKQCCCRAVALLLEATGLRRRTITSQWPIPGLHLVHAAQHR